MFFLFYINYIKLELTWRSYRGLGHFIRSYTLFYINYVKDLKPELTIALLFTRFIRSVKRIVKQDIRVDWSPGRATNPETLSIGDWTNGLDNVYKFITCFGNSWSAMCTKFCNLGEGGSLSYWHDTVK